MRRVLCFCFGHRFQWQQGNKPWRLRGDCSRCGKVEYSLKKEFAERVARWLDPLDYPECAKFIRKAPHPEAPE